MNWINFFYFSIQKYNNFQFCDICGYKKKYAIPLLYRDVNEKRRSPCSCCGWSRRASRSSSSSSWAAATGSGRRGSFSTTRTAAVAGGRRTRRGSGRREGVSQGHPWTLLSKSCFIYVKCFIKWCKNSCNREAKSVICRIEQETFEPLVDL